MQGLCAFMPWLPGCRTGLDSGTAINEGVWNSEASSSAGAEPCVLVTNIMGAVGDTATIVLPPEGLEATLRGACGDAYLGNNVLTDFPVFVDEFAGSRYDSRVQVMPALGVATGNPVTLSVLDLASGNRYVTITLFPAYTESAMESSAAAASEPFSSAKMWESFSSAATWSSAAPSDGAFALWSQTLAESSVYDEESARAALTRMCSDFETLYPQGQGRDLPTLSPDAPGTETCPECELHASPDAPIAPAGNSKTGDGLEFTGAVEGTCSRGNAAPLPEGCEVYRGTMERAQWLLCFRENGLSLDVPVWLRPACASGVAGRCPMSDASITEIADRCGALESSVGRMNCIFDAMRLDINSREDRERYLCRNFARCFKRIYEEMGYSQTYIIRLLSTFGGHAWNEVATVGNEYSPAGKYQIDVYNNILLWCPTR